MNKRFMLIVLQWNARSLCANGQEFKVYISQMKEKPDVICIQESWLNSRLDFVLKGYVSVRRDRDDGKGGGCVTFIKEGMPYILHCHPFLHNSISCRNMDWSEEFCHNKLL